MNSSSNSHNYAEGKYNTDGKLTSCSPKNGTHELGNINQLNDNYNEFLSNNDKPNLTKNLVSDIKGKDYSRLEKIFTSIYPMKHVPVLLKICSYFSEVFDFENNISIFNKVFRNKEEEVSFNDISSEINKYREELKKQKPDIKNKALNTAISTKICDLISKMTNYDVDIIYGLVQSGKRFSSYCTAWIENIINRRNVIWIVRNFLVDQAQIVDDLNGNKPYDFNYKFIRAIFQKEIDTGNTEIDKKDYNQYTLKSPEVINKECLKKLSSHPHILVNPGHNYIIKGRYEDLQKLEKILTKILIETEKKVDIALIVDEADQNAPTGYNNGKSKPKNEESLRSINIAKIGNMCGNTTFYTGTIQWFYSNYKTQINKELQIRLSINNIFVMKIHKDYCGLMNDKVQIKTGIQDSFKINTWWNHDNKYDIEKDYQINIKKIITHIKSRLNQPYSSLAILEQKEHIEHTKLCNLIMKDFSHVFVIIFRGHVSSQDPGLELYFNEKWDNINMEACLIEAVADDNKLNYSDGIVSGKARTLEGSQYTKYFKINTKTTGADIKNIYRVISKIIKNKNLGIHPTIITCTGVYGNRGYSFTSNDYGKYRLHLTDQYSVFHTKLDAVNVLQKLRLQGKYVDNCDSLTLWTNEPSKDFIEKSISHLKVLRETWIKFMHINDSGKRNEKIEKFMKDSDAKLSDMVNTARYNNNRKKTKRKINSKNIVDINSIRLKKNDGRQALEAYSHRLLRKNDLNKSDLLNKIEHSELSHINDQSNTRTYKTYNKNMEIKLQNFIEIKGKKLFKNRNNNCEGPFTFKELMEFYNKYRENLDLSKKQMNNANKLRIDFSEGKSVNCKLENGQTDFSKEYILKLLQKREGVNYLGFNRNNIGGVKLGEIRKRLVWFIDNDKLMFCLIADKVKSTELKNKYQLTDLWTKKDYIVHTSTSIERLLDTIGVEYNNALKNYFKKAKALYVIRQQEEESFSNYIMISETEIIKIMKGIKFKGEFYFLSIQKGYLHLKKYDSENKPIDIVETLEPSEVYPVFNTKLAFKKSKTGILWKWDELFYIYKQLSSVTKIKQNNFIKSFQQTFRVGINSVPRFDTNNLGQKYHKDWCNQKKKKNKKILKKN